MKSRQLLHRLPAVGDTRRRPRSRPRATGFAPGRRGRSPGRRRARLGSPVSPLVHRKLAAARASRRVSARRQTRRRVPSPAPASRSGRIGVALARTQILWRRVRWSRRRARPCRLPTRARASSARAARGEPHSPAPPARSGRRASPTPGGIRARSPRVCSSTARPPARASSTSVGNLARRGDGCRHARLVVAAEQRDRTTKLLHAAAADLLGRPQRLLGGVRVAAQHVPGARHLEHHGRQPVTDEVVDVTSDPTALGQQRLLGELTPGALRARPRVAPGERRRDRRPR